MRQRKVAVERGEAVRSASAPPTVEAGTYDCLFCQGAGSQVAAVYFSPGGPASLMRMRSRALSKYVNTHIGGALAEPDSRPFA